jgi:hypothetical protein
MLVLAYAYISFGFFPPVPLAAQTGHWPLLAGAEGGLYGLDPQGNSTVLWEGGAVRKILWSGTYWALLSDQGIMVSLNLRHWESRNQGLPVRTLKTYREGETLLMRQIQELKDLEFDPLDPETLVTTVKDRVFLSRDGGRSWENLGAPPFRTQGLKAVAVASLPGSSPASGGAPSRETVVCSSHGVYGVSYCFPGHRDRRWFELNAGLERLPGTANPDEVSDIVAAPFWGAGGEQDAQRGPGGPFPRLDIYAAQSFRSRVYRLDWEGKRFVPLWSGGDGSGAVDSLAPGRERLRFVREGGIAEIGRPEAGTASPPPAEFRERWDLLERARTLPGRRGLRPECLLFWEDPNNPRSDCIGLSELWLLDTGSRTRAAGAGNREGIYLPVNHALDPSSLAPYLRILEDRGLDMVVIDMKDDYGRLRYSPQNPAVTEKGRVFQPVDIDAFLRTMKERRIYTAARIVAFKDPELAKKEEGRFAVWDSRTAKPWRGYFDARQARGTGAPANSAYETAVFPTNNPDLEILRTYYDEVWVDPYAEGVWEYNAAIARELQDRGFDEIQFDYIRFPTDGVNLSDARYRWQGSGMDMDSAIISFLRHVRSRVQIPISVDIYGATGWYRTGSRTGQEVELLAPYVDVICPMYYPSHFEQDFLAQAPPELRPYRIYSQGVRRTTLIARGRVIVRPYVQAFFLNVSYDRKYYNPAYVLRETLGVRDAGRGGLTYWNNSGRYDDIPLPLDLEKALREGGR